MTVYPARVAGGRWRAVWYENGQRRQCEAASEDRLAAKLEKVTERLVLPTRPTSKWPGADLIAFYLSADRHPGRAGNGPPSTPTPSGGCASGSSSPVIAGDLLPGHKNSPHATGRERRADRGEGTRLRRALSAMVTAAVLPPDT